MFFLSSSSPFLVTLSTSLPGASWSPSISICDVFPLVLFSFPGDIVNITPRRLLVSFQSASIELWVLGLRDPLDDLLVLELHTSLPLPGRQLFLRAHAYFPAQGAP